MPGQTRNSSDWKRQRAARRKIAEQNQEPCHVCQKPINWAINKADKNNAKAGTIDHLWPIANDGPVIVEDMMSDLAPAHRGCNSSIGQRDTKRHIRPVHNTTTTTRTEYITQVSGPPCAGKTTWIKQQAQPGDTIIDDEELAPTVAARTKISKQQWDDWHRRKSETISNWQGPGHLYVINGNPQPLAFGIKVQLLNPGRDVCHERATNDNRPAETHEWIARWFAKYGTTSTPTESAETAVFHKGPAASPSIGEQKNSPNPSPDPLEGPRTPPNGPLSPVRSLETPNTFEGRKSAPIGSANVSNVLDFGLNLYERTSYGARWFTPAHPLATGTYGIRWSDWSKENLWVDGTKDETGHELRPWQRGVLNRALEHDKDGRLVWKVVIVSLPRQVGKTTLLRVLMTCRTMLLHGKREVMFMSRTGRAAGNSAMQDLFRFAEADDNEHWGIKIRRSNGSESATFRDGSNIFVATKKSAYGRSAGLVVVDEVWDIAPNVLSEQLIPTMAARDQDPGSQLWMFSMASDDATETVFEYMRLAMEADPNDPDQDVCLIDYGALPGEDYEDERTWSLALPGYDESRAKLMRREVKKAKGVSPAIRTQYLNVWPQSVKATQQVGWPAGWRDCEQTPGVPPGGVAGIERSHDQGRWGVAYGEIDDSGVFHCEADVVKTLQEAVEWIQRRKPRLTLCGITLTVQVSRALRNHVLGAGTKDESYGIPAFERYVSSGMVRHDFAPEVMAQSRGAQILVRESGNRLSRLKSSDAGVEALRVLCWVFDAVKQEKPGLATAAIY